MKLLKNPSVELFIAVLQVVSGLILLKVIPGVSVDASGFSSLIGTLLLVVGIVTIWNRIFGTSSEDPLYPSQMTLPQLAENDLSEVKALVAGGKDMLAIKLVCAKSGSGLAEAKFFVEQLKSK